MLVRPKPNKSKNEEYFLNFLIKSYPDKIYQSDFIYCKINGKRFIDRAKRKINRKRIAIKNMSLKKNYKLLNSFVEAGLSRLN